MVSVALGGCVWLPIPHKITETPHVRGVIENNGDPISGVSVRVARGGERNECGGRHIDDTTGQSGEFDIGATRRLIPIMYAVPAHAVVEWYLCHETDTGWKLLGSTQVVIGAGSGFNDRYFFSVKCDISQESQNACEIRKLSEPAT